LAQVAAELGLAPEPDAAAVAVQDWRTAYDEASARRAKREPLLRSRRDRFGDTPLAHLRARAEAAAARAGSLRATITAGWDGPALDAYLESWPEEAAARERRTASRAAATDATAAAAAARARLEAVADPGVAEAEERLAAAETEWEHVVDLDDTLAKTIEFLDRARDRVHASIAPRLNAAVAAMLPVATVGRYTEVMVDPADLAVRVRAPGGPLREARLLSFGTAEQIYLLLRIALAECLVAPGLSCPLIFDDVTVQADSERTAALLNLLLAASERHQVIIFTQQDQVRAWAATALGDPTRHRSISLPTLAG
jgi:DNA repair exonuclease SbcCD ATPase subunit